MENLLYYTISNNEQLSAFKDQLSEIMADSPNPIYFIDKPLGFEEKSFNYEYNEKAIILSPKLKIIIVNCGNDEDSFKLFVEDFEDDLEYLSKKFGYQKYLGRRRSWEECIERININELFSVGAKNFMSYYKAPVHLERRIELLISLLIGSINDIDKIGVDDPETLLDKVKKKIVLFDGMQSRFVYEKTNNKLVRIQGLAGTGKTELLLHKLKETYVGEKNCKIVFTCHNKVLASDMKTRIPKFFDFMRVEEQIAWNERLWVFPSWGSRGSFDSGLYSYICLNYGIPFRRYSEVRSFDEACRIAIEDINSLGYIKPCFDYIFIDESQDFSENFFKLCDIVTRKQIYIAGDIFQDVFDSNIKASVSSDYLLNRCYRTDPKTLMLAHSIGMGLYEKPVIRWLDDVEWEACGYSIRRNNDSFILARSPLRRFEDVDISGKSSIKIIKVKTGSMVDKILDCIDEILKENRTVKPDDIAVILLGNSDKNYFIADQLSFIIEERFNWDSTKGYISKTKEKDKIFISNIYNVKGLEFPFVICVESGSIDRSIQKRNSIYMALTRSFLSSYFLIDEMNCEFISIYQNAIDDINRNGYMTLREPDEEEKRTQAERVRIAAEKRKKSLEEIVDEVCNEHPEISYNVRKNLLNMSMDSLVGKEEDRIKEYVNKLMQTLIEIENGANI